MNQEKKYFCDKCNTPFRHKGHYYKHLKKPVPCNYVCTYCDTKCGSRTAFYQHRKMCEGTEKKTKNTINNIVNNVDASVNNNLNQYINRNLVFMTPFGLEYEYMNQKFVVEPIRDVVVDLLKKDKYKLAYEALFKQIHGNNRFPEFHNIYMDDIESSDLCIFKGFDFRFETLQDKLPHLFFFLKNEMDKLVQSADLEPMEKSQLRWNIQANWMCINEKDDKNMKRILHENKKIVHETLEKYKVQPDNKRIIYHLGFTPDDLLTDHQVRIPLKKA